LCDCIDTNTASEDVTQPLQARQSVREICAVVFASLGEGLSDSTETASSLLGGGGGSVSTGLMQATEGAIKSFRVSAERIADIVAGTLE